MCERGPFTQTMQRLFFLLLLFFCVFVWWRTHTKSLLSCRHNVHICHIKYRRAYQWIQCRRTEGERVCVRLSVLGVRDQSKSGTKVHRICVFGTMIKFWAIKFAPFLCEHWEGVQWWRAEQRRQTNYIGWLQWAWCAMRAHNSWKTHCV